jgi:hypothetical protein
MSLTDLKLIFPPKSIICKKSTSGSGPSLVPVLVSKQGPVLYRPTIPVPELNPNFEPFPAQFFLTKPKPVILTCQTRYYHPKLVTA